MQPEPVRKKPRLRGVSHEVAAYLSLPVAWVLLNQARGHRAFVAALTYGASLILLFSASAIYHRPHWRPRPRNLIGRVDQASIFVLIAGTYTPFCLMLAGGGGRRMLLAVWTSALAGVVLALVWHGAPKRLMAGIYVLQGWFVIPVLPSLYAALPGNAFALLLLGGLLYTVGAAVYAFRHPNPYPAVFGYHEIFHLFVLGAAACHAVVVSTAIQALG
ncbi:MAG TPA: hemolysin III family protein [Anaeromyxobacter sp.]|nr:hemolysin III family protein [Anaeromyxobacter sp.]